MDGVVGMWTAGQRIDPQSCTSPFVWKTSPCSMAEMAYSKWCPGQPDFWRAQESCANMFVYNETSAVETCWNDIYCETEMCFVCEISRWRLNVELAVTYSGATCGKCLVVVIISLSLFQYRFSIHCMLTSRLYKYMFILNSGILSVKHRCSCFVKALNFPQTWDLFRVGWKVRSGLLCCTLAVGFFSVL